MTPLMWASLRNPPIRSWDIGGTLEVLIQSCRVTAHQAQVNESRTTPRTPT